MKKFMPKIMIALAMLVGGTYVLQTVQPFAEKTVEAAGSEDSVTLTEGDVFTYGEYKAIAGTNKDKVVPLRWRIVYANNITKEAVAMTEQPIEQASQGWNTNCYYAKSNAGNCTDAPWKYDGGSNTNKSILTAAQGVTANQVIDGKDSLGVIQPWKNAYFGGSVADWMDRYFVPNFVSSIQGSAFGEYVGYYDGANKDQYHEATKKSKVLVDWFDKGTRVLAKSNGDNLTTKDKPRAGNDVDTTGMYNPYIYTMPFSYTTDGTTLPIEGGKPKLTDKGFPYNAKLDENTKLPQGETYGDYQYPSTWISYSTISLYHIGYIQYWVDSNTYGDRAFVNQHPSNSWNSSTHNSNSSKIFSNFTGTIYWYDSNRILSPGGASFIYQRPALYLKNLPSKFSVTGGLSGPLEVQEDSAKTSKGAKVYDVNFTTTEVGEYVLSLANGAEGADDDDFELCAVGVDGANPTCGAVLKYTPALAGEAVDNKFYVRTNKDLVGAATDATDGKAGKKYVVNVTVDTPSGANAASATIGGELRVTEPTLKIASGSTLYDEATSTATLNVRTGTTQAEANAVLDTMTLTGGATSRYTLEFVDTPPSEVILDRNTTDTGLSGVASGESYNLKVGSSALSATDAKKTITFKLKAKNTIDGSAKETFINYVINIYPEYPTALQSTAGYFTAGSENYPFYPSDTIEAGTLLMTVSPTTTPDASVDKVVYSDIKIEKDGVDITDQFDVVHPIDADKNNLYIKAKAAGALEADVYKVTATATFTDKGTGADNVTTTKSVTNSTPFELTVGAPRPDVSVSATNSSFTYKDDIYSGTNMVGTISAASIDNPSGYPPTKISKIELPAGVEKNDFFTLDSNKNLYVNKNKLPAISDSSDGNGIFKIQLKVTTEDGKIHDKTLNITMNKREVTLQVKNMSLPNNEFNGALLGKTEVTLKSGAYADGENLASLGVPNLIVTDLLGNVITLNDETAKNYGPGEYKIKFVSDSEFTSTGDKYQNYNVKFDDSGDSGKLTITAQTVTNGYIAFNIKNGASIADKDLNKFYNSAIQIKPNATAIAAGFTLITDRADASGRPILDEESKKGYIDIPNEEYQNRTFYLMSGDGTKYSKPLTLTADQFVKIDTQKPNVELGVTKNSATMALGYLAQSNISFQYFKSAINVRISSTDSTKYGSEYISGTDKVTVFYKDYGTSDQKKILNATFSSGQTFVDHTNYITVDGTYDIEATATDKAGNVSDSAHSYTIIGKNGPAAPILNGYQVESSTNLADVPSWKIEDNKYTTGNWAYKKKVIIVPSASDPTDTGIQGFAWRKAGGSESSFVNISTCGAGDSKSYCVEMTEDGTYDIEVAAYWTSNTGEKLYGPASKFKVMMENDDLVFNVKGTAFYDGETDIEYTSGEATNFNVRLSAMLGEDIDVPVVLQYRVKENGSSSWSGWNTMNSPYQIENTSSGSYNYEFKLVCPSNIVNGACPNPDDSPITFDVTIARAAITQPTITASVLNADDTKGNKYVSNTWTNKDIIFELSGGIDQESLLNCYEYQAVAKGATPDDTKWNQLLQGSTKLKTLRTYVNVETNSEIDYYFRVRPSYGEPGPYNQTPITVRIDKTNPKIDTVTLTPQTSTLTMDLLRALSFDNFGKTGMDFAISTKADVGSPLTVTYTLKRGDSVINNNAKYTNPVSVTNEGAYTVTANVKDEAGNTGIPVTKTFAVDNTAPEYSGLVSGNSYYLPKIIKFTDAISGINKGASMAETNGSMDFTGQSFQSITLTHDDVTNGVDETTYKFNIVDNSGNQTSVTAAIKKLPEAADIISDNDPDKIDKWQGVIDDIEEEIKNYPPVNKPFYDERVEELKKALAQETVPVHTLDEISDFSVGVGTLVQITGTVHVDPKFPDTNFTFDLLHKNSDGTYVSIQKAVGTNADGVSTAVFSLGTATGDTAGDYRLVVSDSIHTTYQLSDDFIMYVQKKTQDDFKPFTYTTTFNATQKIDLSAQVKTGKGALTFGTSDDTSVIECDSAGKNCTMKKAGTASFQVTAAGDSTYKEKTIKLQVVVKQGVDGSYSFTNITSNPQSYTYGAADIDLTINPDVVAAGRKAPTYISSDSNVVQIVEVDSGAGDGTTKFVGRIVGAGSAKIDAVIPADGKYEETVVSANVIVNRATITVKPNDETKAIGTMNPVFSIKSVSGALVGSDTLADLGTPKFEVMSAGKPVDETTGPGVYTIKLTGFDAGAKTNSYDITIDPQPGTLEITPQAASSGDYTADPTRAKDGSWVNQDVTIAPVNYEQISIGNNIYKNSEVITAEGSNDYDIVLKRGNVITSAYEQTFKIDKTAPTLVVSESSVTSGTSVSGYIASVAGGSAYKENMVITLAATDQTNLSGIDYYEYSVDELAPDGSIVTNFIPNTKVNPDAITGDAKFTLSPTKGVHLIVRATAYDKAGNSTTEERDIIIDTTKPAAPTVTAPVISGKWTSKAIEKITVEDNKNIPTASGVKEIQVCTLATCAESDWNAITDNPFTATKTKTYKFRVCNTLDECGAITEYKANIDTYKPEFTVAKTPNADGNGVNTTNVRFTLTQKAANAQTPNSGVRYFYSKDNKVTWTEMVGKNTLDIVNNEINDYYFKAVTGAGVEYVDIAKYSVHVELVNLSKPVMKVQTASGTDYDGTKWTNEAVTMKFDGTMPDSSLATLQYAYCSAADVNCAADKIAENSWKSVPANSHTAYTTLASDNTEQAQKYFFRFKTKGLQVSSVSDGYTVKIDKTNPAQVTPTLTKKELGYHVDIAPVASEHGDDTPSVYYQYLSSKNAPLGAWTPVPSDGFDITADGTYYIAVQSKDEAGNASANTITGPIIVDNEDPVITVTPNLNETYLGKQINISDAGSGLASVTINGKTAAYDTTTGTYSTYINKAGKYIIEASDVSGRITTTQEIVIKGLPSLSMVKNTPEFKQTLEDIETELRDNPIVHASQKGPVEDLRNKYDALVGQKHTIKEIGVKDENDLYWIKATSGDPAGFNINTEITAASGSNPEFGQYKLYKRDSSNNYILNTSGMVEQNKSVKIHKEAIQDEAGVYKLEIEDNDGSITVSNVFEVVVDKKQQNNFITQVIPYPYAQNGVIDLTNILANAVGKVTLVDGPADGVIENVDTAADPVLTNWKILKSGMTKLTLHAAGDTTYAEKTIELTIVVQQQKGLLAFNELNPKLQVVYGDGSFDAIASSSNNTTGTITYTSTDENVLKVDAAGKVTIIGKGTADIRATLSASENFTTETVSRTFTVNPKPIMVKPAPASMVAGSEVPSFTLEPVTGLINGATIAAFGEPQFSTTATSTSSVGGYPITITGFDATTRDESIAKNYELIYTGAAQTGTLTIKGRPGNLATDMTTTPNYDFATSPWTNQPIVFTPAAPFTKMTINNSPTEVTSFTANQIGAITYSVAFKNDQNLVTKPVNAVVKYDPTAPDVTGIQVANGTSGDNSRTIKIAATDQSGLSGMNTIHVIVEKINANNDAEDLIMDKTDPSTLNSVTGKDELSVDVASLDDGNYRITAYAADKAGNVSVAKNDTFIVETQKGYAPKITVAPDKNFLKGTATITVQEDSAYPVLSGVDHFIYTVDGVAPADPVLVPANGKATLNVTTDGKYEFKIVSKAEQAAATAAGTTPTGGNSASVTLKFDNATPLLNVEESKTSASHTFTLSNTEAAQLGTTTYLYRKGNGQYQEIPNHGTTVTFTSESDNGQYQFKAISEAGIESAVSDSHTVNIETVGFESLNVDVTSGKTNAWTNEPVEFEITGGLSDMTKLLEYQYCVVGVDEAVADCNQWNTVTMHADASNVIEKGTYNIAGDGEYNVFFKAVTKNYYEDSDEIAGPFKVQIDTIAPSKAVISNPTMITTGSYTYKVEIKAPAGDHPGEAMQVEYQTSNSIITPTTWSQVPTNGVELKQDGTYYIHARVTDEAGNVTTSYYNNPIVVDTHNPDIKVEPSVSASASTYLGRKVTIGDQGSGLKTITINNAAVNYSGGVYSAYIKDAGTYTFVATDNVGRKTTVSFTIKGLPGLSEVKNTPEFGDKLDEIEAEYAKNPTIHATQKNDIDALRAAYTRLTTKAHVISTIGTPSTDGSGKYYVHASSGNAEGYKIEANITPMTDFESAVFSTYELFKQDENGVFQSVLSAPMGSDNHHVLIKRDAISSEKGTYRLDITESDGTITSSNYFDVVIDKKDQINLKGADITKTFSATDKIDLTEFLNKAAVPGTVTLDTANSTLNSVLEADPTNDKIFNMKQSGTAILIYNAPGNDIYNDKSVTFKVTVNPQASQIAFKDPSASLTHTYGDASFSAQAESTQRPTATISYASSDENVLTVDASGNVTIIGAGNADITATIASDISYGTASVVNSYTINKKKLTIMPEEAEMVAGEALPTPTIKEAQGLLATDSITDFGDPVFRMVDVYNNEVTADTPEGQAKIYFDHFVDGTNVANPNVTKNYVLSTDTPKPFNALNIRKRTATATTDLIIDPAYDVTTSPWTNQPITLTPNAPYTTMQVNNSGVYVNSYSANQVGSQTYGVRLKMANGLTAGSMNVNIKYDPKAPTIVSNVITNGTNSNDRKIKVVAADQADLSGVKEARVILSIVDANNDFIDHNIATVEGNVIEDSTTHEMYMDAEFTNLEDARYMASISVLDNAGNRSAEKPVYFVVENANESMPLVSVDPDKPYLTGTATITLAEDPNYPVLSGIHHFIYTVDGVAPTDPVLVPTNGKATLNVTAGGKYEFKIVSNEEFKASGNASTGGNAAIKELKFDNAIPKLSIAETKNSSSHTFTLSNLETNSSDVTYFMKKDSGQYVQVGNVVTITDSAENGKYYFKAVSGAGIESTKANDGVTNTAYKVNIETATFTDITVTPEGSDWTNKTPVKLTLTGGLSDMTKLQEYKYCITSITGTVNDCTADKWMSITPVNDSNGNFLNASVSKASEGSYRYFFKVVTKSGYEGTPSKGYDVLIDLSDPAGIEIDSATQTENGYTVVVKPLAADAQNDISAEYKILPYGMQYNDPLAPAANDVPSDNTINVTGVRGSRYQLGFLVTDEAGNYTLTYSDANGYTIPLKDGLAPKITLNPKPTNANKKSYLPIKVSVVDYDDDGVETTGITITDEVNGVVNPVSSPYVVEKGAHKITAKDANGNTTTETFEVLGIPNVNDVKPTPEYEAIINEMKKELGEAKDGVGDLYKDKVQAIEDRYNALKNKHNTYSAQISNDPLYVGGAVEMEATIVNDVNFPNTIFSYELHEKQSNGTYKKIATIDSGNASIVTTPGIDGAATTTKIKYTITSNAAVDGTFSYKLCVKDKDTDLVEDVQFNATVLPKLIGHELQSISDVNVKVQQPMNFGVTIKLDPAKLDDASKFNVTLYQAAEGVGTNPKQIAVLSTTGITFQDDSGNTYITYKTDPHADFAKADYSGKDFYVKVKNQANTYTATSSNFKIFVDLLKQDQLVAGYREMNVGTTLTVDETLIQGILGTNMKVEFNPVNGLKDEETSEQILTDEGSGVYKAVNAGEAKFDVTIKDQNIPANYEDATTTLTIRVVKSSDYAFSINASSPFATYGDTGDINLSLNDVLPASDGNVEFTITDDSRKDVVVITNDPANDTATMKAKNAGTVKIVARQTGSATLDDKESQPIEFTVKQAELQIKAKDIDIATVADFNKIVVDNDNTTGLKNGDLITDLGTPVFKTDAAEHNYAIREYDIKFDHFENATAKADNYHVVDALPYAKANVLGSMAAANDFYTDPLEAKTGSWMNKNIMVYATNSYESVKVTTPDGEGTFAAQVPIDAVRNEGKVSASIQLKDANGLKTQELPWEFYFDTTAPHINSVTYSYTTDGTPISNIIANASDIYNKVLYINVETDDINTAVNETSGVNNCVLNFEKKDGVGEDSGYRKFDSVKTANGVTTYQFRLEDSAFYTIWPTVTDTAGNVATGARQTLTLDAKIPSPPDIIIKPKVKSRMRTLADYQATDNTNAYISDTVDVELSGNGGSLGVHHYEYCRVNAAKECAEQVDGNEVWQIVNDTNIITLPNIPLESGLGLEMNGALNYKFRIVNTAMVPGNPGYTTIYRDDVKPELEVTATSNGANYVSGDTTDKDVIFSVKKAGLKTNVSGVTYEYYTDKDSTRRAIIDISNGANTLRVSNSQATTYYFVAVSGAKVVSDPIEYKVKIERTSALDFQIDKAYFSSSSSDLYTEGAWTNAKSDIVLKLTANDPSVITNGGYYEYTKGTALAPGSSWSRFTDNKLITSTMPEGNNYFYIRLNDGTQTGNPVLFQVRIDKTNPGISYTAIADPDEEHATSYDVTLTANDEIAGASTGDVKIYYVVKDSTTGAITYGSPVNNTANITVSGNNQYRYLYYKACDVAGNCTADTMKPLKFGDTTKPLESLDINIGGELINQRDPSDSNKPYLNIDTNGDGQPDVNIDVTKDGIPDINLAIINSWNPTSTGNAGGVQYLYDATIQPTINVTTKKPYTIAETNIDTNGDMQPDINVVWYDADNNKIVYNQVKMHVWMPKSTYTDPASGFKYLSYDSSLKAEVNKDTNGDHYPDTNIDTNGDYVAEFNKDIDKDGYPDLTIDTTGDGVADINIDLDGDGQPNKNITVVNSTNWHPDLIGKTANGFWYSTTSTLVATKPDVPVNPTNPDDSDDPSDPGNNGGGNNNNGGGNNNNGGSGDNGGGNIIYIPTQTTPGGNGTVSVVDPTKTGANGTTANGTVTTGNNFANSGVCGDLNIDTNKDGIPDLNIDVDGDGVADYNIDTNCDSKADKNILSKASVLGLYQSHGTASQGDDIFRFALVALATVLLLLLLIFLKKHREDGDDEFEEIMDEGADY